MKALLLSLSFLAIALIIGACGNGEGDGPPPAPPKTCPTDGVVVNLTSSPYAFDPKDFSFTTGTTYTLCLVADHEFHTFTIDELGIDASVKPNETVVQDITPDKAGVFELFCTPHRFLKMIGEVRVN